MDFIEERNSELYAQYLKIIKQPGHPTSDKELFSLIADSPARQYYISIRKALYYVIQLDRGEIVSFRNPQKAEQIHDLYDRYLVLRSRMRGHRKTFIVQQAVLSPAPKFYLSWITARTIIMNYK